MLRLLRNKKAQSTAEYAILFAVVIGAFSLMQLYVKRGLNARIKDGMDNVPGIIAGGEPAAGALFSAQKQYEPYYTREGTSDMTTTSSQGSEIFTASETGGKRDLKDATTAREGEQVIAGIDAVEGNEQ